MFDSIEALFHRQQEDIIRIICKRIAAVGRMNPTSVMQLRDMVKYQNADIDAIKRTIRKYLGLAHTELEKIYTEAMYEARGYVDIVSDMETAAKNYDDIVSAAVSRSMDYYLNISRTYAFKIDNRIIPWRQAYVNTINRAVFAVTSGTMDYGTAMQAIIDDMAGNGFRHVVSDKGDISDKRIEWYDENGVPYYSRRVDSSAKLNLMEGVRQVNMAIMDDATPYATGFEISAHDLPAPDHAPIQGMQYTRQEYADLNAGLQRPIGTLNCMHFAYPIVYGKTKPRYTQSELERFRQNSEREYEWRGKKYNGYECTQKQRNMETAIRRTRDRMHAFEDAGLTGAAQREAARFKEQYSLYKDFSEAVGLSVKTNRIGGIKR